MAVVLSHDTSGCVEMLVHLRRIAAALGRCVCVLVCVDARDARGCVSTLRLGCQTSLCCCSACVSLAAFPRCLQLLCFSVCRALVCTWIASLCAL